MIYVTLTVAGLALLVAIRTHLRVRHLRWRQARLEYLLDDLRLARVSIRIAADGP